MMLVLIRAGRRKAGEPRLTLVVTSQEDETGGPGLVDLAGGHDLVGLQPCCGR